MSIKSRTCALYIDENIAQRTVEALRVFGHDVLTLREDGKASRRHPDDAEAASSRTPTSNHLRGQRKTLRSRLNRPNVPVAPLPAWQ